MRRHVTSKGKIGSSVSSRIFIENNRRRERRLKYAPVAHVHFYGRRFTPRNQRVAQINARCSIVLDYDPERALT